MLNGQVKICCLCNCACIDNFHVNSKKNTDFTMEFTIVFPFNQIQEIHLSPLLKCFSLFKYNLPQNYTSNNKYDQHMQMSPLQSVPNSLSRNLKSIKIHYVRYSKSLFQTKIYLVRNKINSKTVYKLEFCSHNMKKFGCVFQ